MCWKYEHNNFQLWVFATVYTSLLIGIQKSLQILSSFISLNVSSDWNYHHQKGNYPVSMLTSCHIFFWPEQHAYHKDDVLYMEQNSDKARNLIRLSNMLLTHRKTRCLLLYICFQFKFGHFFLLICNSQNHKAHYFENRMRIQIHVWLCAEYWIHRSSENLYNFVILYAQYVFLIELVSVLAWDGLWVKCFLAYLFVGQPPCCIVIILHSLFKIISTLYTVSDCIKGIM